VVLGAQASRSVFRVIRLAVTPLFILFATGLVLHYQIDIMADFYSCAYHDGSISFKTAEYWKIVTETAITWQTSISIISFGIPVLPFAIAAFFIRAPKRLYWQWAGLVIIICGLYALFSSPQTPGWCLEGEFIPGFILLVLIGFLIFVTLPVFAFVTWAGPFTYNPDKKLN
jgi:hypothetical protein